MFAYNISQMSICYLIFSLGSVINYFYDWTARLNLMAVHDEKLSLLSVEYVELASASKERPKKILKIREKSKQTKESTEVQ